MEETIEIHRAFIALDIPSVAKPRLLTHVIALQQHKSLETLRWIPKANWHLTLAFLGDQTEPVLLDLWQALLEALQNQSPVPASVKCVSGFPDAKSPVLAAILEPTDALEVLQTKVQQLCEFCGISLDRRKFKPHITLARSRKRQPVRYQGPPLNLTAHWCSITLYTSKLTPDGSLYTPLRSLNLE